MIDFSLKKLIICLVIPAMLITGCVKKEEAVEEAPVVRDYSEEQMCLMLSGRKAEVRNVFGDEVFGIKMSDAGDKYNDVFNDMAKDYIEKVFVMTEIASEYGITLSVDEKKSIEKRASKYMDDLAGSGMEEKIAKDDVIKVMTDMLCIDKLKSQLIESSGIEVSESEARVMDITRIEFDNSEDAYTVLDEINNSDTEFVTIARRNSTNAETELKVGRGDLGAVIDDEIFDMEEGEISPVIQSQGKYYIIKIEKGYDAEATAVRREKMKADRENDVVGKAYSDFIKDKPYTIDDSKWQKVLNMIPEYENIPDIYEY